MRTSEQASARPAVTGSASKGKDNIDYESKKLREILWREAETIKQRRHVFKISPEAEKEIGPGKPPADLFGIALSGGGIRSASFCLGALQALDQFGVLRRADYLSTVSGGGYIAASMAAAMSPKPQPESIEGNTSGSENSQEKSPDELWEFPFAVGTTSDVSDSEPVGHIRDYGKFLAPRGFYDIGISTTILMRGLAVNLLLLLSVLLPLATIIILTNPSRENLNNSILADLAKFVMPGHLDSATLAFISDPFIMTKAAAMMLAGWLIGWALRRSYSEGTGKRHRNPSLEQSGLGARLARKLLILLLVAFAIEIQPRIINGLIDWMAQSRRSGNLSATITALAATAGSVIALTATFQATFVVWIERALNSRDWGPWLQAMIARAAFLALGLALPFVIYGLFLILVIWGIRIPEVEGSPYLPEAEGNPYPYSPAILVATDWSQSKIFVPVLAVSVIVLVFCLARWIYARFRPAWKQVRKGEIDIEVVLWIPALTGILALSAFATRTEASAQEWYVLTNYLVLTALVLIIAINFTENANGLHRLYRDRLRVTFRMGRLNLHELGDRSPYLLINGTLNVRRPKKVRTDNNLAQPKTGASAVPADPAKRGRNAEFFVFSRHFTGSDATGYLDSKAINQVLPELDLAAAAAISGAAVSSSMGRIGIGLLGPTLALLNLRLGCWLPNPQDPKQEETDWDRIFPLYLFAEAFGRLRSDSSRIYITDGGHIDNIGLYQLLKRRCRFIMVIDAEADSGMNFSAFADVQRFARIDEGASISLDWRPVREAGLARLADRSKATPESHRLHFATGRILYKDGTEGILLYVKATVTGDEPDYVLDYERRYPSFPHEATSDQFFSEEQMEAYRALGFHATCVALDDPPEGKEATHAAPTERDALVQALKKELGAKVSIRRECC